MKQSLNALIALLLVAAPAAAEVTVTTDAASPAQAVAGHQGAVASVNHASTSTLAALVVELERNSPELKAARREVDMRVARIAPAGAPPDPTFSVGYMGGLLRAPFFPSASAPDSFRQFGLSQEIPYPGKRGLKSRVAATEADAERWSYENTRKRLIADKEDISD